jgi:hypothetical protein
MELDLFIDPAPFIRSRAFVQGEAPFCGKWEQRHPWNVPGPFYCGDDDSCGTGPLVAPNNIILGNDTLGDVGGELVFRQPVNRFELEQVLEAAQINTMQAYGCDGNQRWTLPLVQEWWQQRSTIERAVTAERDRQLRLGGDKDYVLFTALERYRRFLRGDVAPYLRLYMYFLNEGRAAKEGDPLPELS